MRKELIVKALSDLESFLDAHGVKDHAAYIRERRRMVESSPEELPRWLWRELDEEALKTLTDLVISKREGDTVEDEGDANRNLGELRHNLWKALQS